MMSRSRLAAPRSRVRHPSMIVALALLSCSGGGAAWAQQVKGRVMVMVDTSGSMVAHFGNNNSCGGDGDFNSRYTDRNVAGRNYYPGNLVMGGQPDGKNSRMYAAKLALTNVLNATGSIDFGLMRYAPAPVPNGCQNNLHCCNFNTPQCIRNLNYIDNGGLMNWNGDCGPIQGNIATDGGQILVVPGNNSSSQVLPWADNIEDFRDNGQGNPMNPELRCAGLTPMAGSARTALSKWYQPIYNVSKQGQGGYNPNSPLFDPQLDCRPYVLVMMTDGADTCDGDPINGPPNAVAAMWNANAANHPLTYVIGLAFQQGDPAIGVLNNMATQGHTGSARFANDQSAIEAALADIVASSVRVEVCNNKDDNCNMVVDEGFDKGAQCTTGLGACAKTGMKKCDPNNNTQTTCCVNDNMPNGACVPLVAGMPVKEVCNGIDDDCNGIIDDPPVCMGQQCQPETCNGKDDDCDGIIDNKLIDTGRSCGINVGICRPGTTVCLNSKNQDVAMNGIVPDAMDHLVCQGGVMPAMESCDGLDNDCDGVVDGMSRACYGGAMGTDGVGECHGGSQKCTALPGSGVAMWGGCVGEVVPVKEICDGLDNDCNGKIDDPPGFGQPCCPSNKCGVGICLAGTMQCSGGVLSCVGGQGPRVEICNNLDDDCNGKVDDLGNIGAPCVAPNGCPGKLGCDLVKMMHVCVPDQMNCGPMDCNADPRVGQPCGPGVGLPAPCKPGKWACENGRVVCQGGHGPASEICNCEDDDCNTRVDDDAFCPGGTACIPGACACLGPCGKGEFPCAGGFSCVDVACKMDADCPGNWGARCNNGACEPGYCAPTERCNPPCMAPLVCDVDKCVDPCAGKMCPDGFKCVRGNCEDQTCRRIPQPVQGLRRHLRRALQHLGGAAGVREGRVLRRHLRSEHHLRRQDRPMRAQLPQRHLQAGGDLRRGTVRAAVLAQLPRRPVVRPARG